MLEEKNIFGPVKRKRSFEEVSSEIKRLIFKGVLKVGDRLPSEAELAKKFNVGRQTIREALRVLELSGLIQVPERSGGGPMITDTILNTIGKLYLGAFLLAKVTVAELTSARLGIEKAILRLVIDKASDDDIRALQENVERAKKKIESQMMATDENYEFHALLAKASKNQIFLVLERSINARHRDLISRLVPDFHISRNAFKFHERILKGIMAKKRDEALNLMEQHIFEIGECLCF